MTRVEVVASLRGWDRFFDWGHPRTSFSLAGLEKELRQGGLKLERRWKVPAAFGAYCARKNSSTPVAANSSTN